MNWLIAFCFRAIGFLIASLPKAVREAIGNGIGFLWFDVFRIRRKIAIANLTIAYPEKTLQERTHLARESLKSLGRTLMEYSLFPFFKSSDVDRYFDFENEHYIKDALKEGRGVLLLTLHLGNGDFAVASLSRRGYPVHLISKEFKAKWLNDMWFGMRRKHGTRFIAAEKSSFDILRALRKNEVVVFVLDQWMGPPVGVRTRFFGKETGTAMGLAIIADRTRAPVLPCYTWQRPGGKHVSVFGPQISFQDQGDKEKNIAVMTQIYTDKIEEMVRLHPEQWMWIHRRWKEFRD